MPTSEDQVAVETVDREPIAVATPVATPIAAASKSAPRPARRRRGGFLIALLLIGTATLAVGSTLVAMRAIDERDKAQADLANLSHAYGELTAAVASMKPAKKEVLQPVADYYQRYIQTHSGDAKITPALITAKLHLAALQVKLGSKEGVTYLAQAMTDLNGLAKDPDLDPQTIPSLQGCTLRVAAPIEWAMVKGADQAYYLGLMMAINNANGNYQRLSHDFPAVTSLRDDFSATLKVLALLQSQIAPDRALPMWVQGIPVNESLVKDQPQNADYNARLIECLVNAARLQKDKERDQAVANLKRAVEVRQQLASAAPDDKTLQKELAKLKTELEKLEAAPPPAAEAPPAEPAAEPAADPAA
jgi:hypothetical protein